MRNKAITLGGLAALLVLIQLINMLLGGRLAQFGIHPRDMGSAYTILTAPLIHGDWTHLGNNLLALLPLAALSMADGLRRFAIVSAIILLLGGALVWLLGRHALHIGASGWIFGLWSYVIARGWFERAARAILLSLLVLLVYGSMIWGVLPTDARISFESHLFGALAGVVAAFVVRRPRQEVAAPANNAPKFWA